MARRLNNWSYQDVTDFLKENRFSFFEELDDHQVWVKLQRGRPVRFVEFDFRSGKYPVETMEDIISQSGIVEKDWIEWAGS